MKTAQCFDFLGVLFNMGVATAHRNFAKYLAVAERALRQKDSLPRRSFSNLNDFKEYL